MGGRVPCRLSGLLAKVWQPDRDASYANRGTRGCVGNLESRREHTPRRGDEDYSRGHECRVPDSAPAPGAAIRSGDRDLSGVNYSFRSTTTIIPDSCWNF